MKLIIQILLVWRVGFMANGFELARCNRSQYYDPALMTCQSCPANVSMITSPDGFSCVCDDHSVKINVSKCKSCNATAVVSSDGTTCVPRRCQNTSGRFVCRKCPNDYIFVTQNPDGSPMKEVTCVKCSRGYRSENNVCVKCESCACTKQQTAVRDICVPKKYLSERPKYEETRLHINIVSDFVKHEYLCIQNDFLACRTLAEECVKNLYSTDLAGPCRLWIQPKITPPKGLPPLTVESFSDKNPGEFSITRGKNNLLLTSAAYTPEGGIKITEDPVKKAYLCFLPIQIKIGIDISYKCDLNISDLSPIESDSTFGVYFLNDGEYKPVPVTVKKPNGYYIKGEIWKTSKFRRYFLAHKTLSATVNMSTTVYLRTLIIRLQIQRDKYPSASLRGDVSIEVQYATKSPLTHLVTTFLKVENEMPNAGVIRGLEIGGGILSSLLTVYALVLWRGNLRRGGFHFSLVPLISGALADALYFAVWFSTLHALAAEAGTLGMTLPLSHYEESTIKAFIYSSVSLKLLKVVWVNWNQCRCDIFLLDWSEYNSPFEKDTMSVKYSDWKIMTLAREWCSKQTKRRAPPAYTVTFTLLLLYLMTPWQSYLPNSKGYKWSIATIAWWTAYAIVISGRFIQERIFGSITTVLPSVCSGLGLSLFVFQEDYYAHYVHGRNDDSKDMRSMAGPLSTCRVIVAPQLRTVYKQLSNVDAGISLGVKDSRQALLSQFLAAFFERALDGLNWVASERTMVERLLDVELTVRESGSTSALLYHPDDDNTPSCFNVTWWGEEWILGTFDAMLFGAIIYAVENSLLAAFITLATWQVMKNLRSWSGIRNIREKTGIEVPLF